MITTSIPTVFGQSYIFSEGTIVNNENITSIGKDSIESTRAEGTKEGVSLVGMDFILTARENDALLQGGYIHSDGKKWNKTVNNFTMESGAYFKVTNDSIVTLNNVTMDLTTYSTGTGFGQYQLLQNGNEWTLNLGFILTSDDNTSGTFTGDLNLVISAEDMANILNSATDMGATIKVYAKEGQSLCFDSLTISSDEHSIQPIIPDTQSKMAMSGLSLESESNLNHNTTLTHKEMGGLAQDLDNNIAVFQIGNANIPEPSSAILFLVGLGSAALRRRRN